MCSQYRNTNADRPCPPQADTPPAGDGDTAAAASRTDQRAAAAARRGVLGQIKEALARAVLARNREEHARLLEEGRKGVSGKKRAAAADVAVAEGEDRLLDEAEPGAVPPHCPAAAC